MKLSLRHALLCLPLFLGPAADPLDPGVLGAPPDFADTFTGRRVSAGR